MAGPSLSLLLRAVGAALAVAAGVALTLGRAAAGCGDYLTVHGRPPAESTHTRPDPGTPCHGPGCSGDSTPAAPLTAPAVEPSRGHDSAAISPATVIPTAAAGRRPVADPAAAPVHLPQPVFHPPRGR